MKIEITNENSSFFGLTMKARRIRLGYIVSSGPLKGMGFLEEECKEVLTKKKKESIL
jgi:hypothetical protein